MALALPCHRPSHLHHVRMSSFVMIVPQACVLNSEKHSLAAFAPVASIRISQEWEMSVSSSAKLWRSCCLRIQGKRSWRRNSNLSLNAAPLQSLQTRASFKKTAALPNPLDWYRLHSVCPIGLTASSNWNVCPRGQRGSRESSTNTTLLLFFSVHSSQFVVNLYLSLCPIHPQTPSVNDAHRCVSVIVHGEKRQLGLFVRRHRGLMAAIPRHLLRRGASVIWAQHRPGWWSTEKTFFLSASRKQHHRNNFRLCLLIK